MSNVATKLVEIAEELFTFGSVTAQTSHRHRGDPNPAVHTYASPKRNPDLKRPLADIRPDLAEVYQATYGSVPSATARRAVVIGAYGWEIVEHSPVLFWRTNATLPLPTPDDLGSLDDLRSMLNVAGDDWPLIVAWLVAALIPEIPHPVLLLKGEHGTAKSTAARLVTSLLDRCASQLRTAPRNVEDWAVACAGSWVTCLDNVSDIQHWLQDAICRAVTGDGLLRRQLYTDSDVTVLAFRRVIGLTSIDPGQLNGDLADRLLTVELERIPDTARAAEEQLTEKWTGIHAGPRRAAAHHRQRSAGAGHGPHHRPATHGRLRPGAARCRPRPRHRRLRHLQRPGRQNRRAGSQGDSVAVAIRETIRGPWIGTASELLKAAHRREAAEGLPTTPQGMGGRISRVAPPLRSLGWTVERPPRSDKKGSRWWSIVPPSEEYPAGSSASSVSSDTLADQHKRTDEAPDDLLAIDDLAGDPTDDHWLDVSAGHDVTDDPDMPAGYSSEETP